MIECKWTMHSWADTFKPACIYWEQPAYYRTGPGFGAPGTLRGWLVNIRIPNRDEPYFQENVIREMITGNKWDKAILPHQWEWCW